jgi:hypothetical protein
MSTENDLWHLEEKFWLGDAEFYERTLASCALMVLPEPAGVLDRAATVQSIRSGPRWQNISFTHQRHAEPNSSTTILAYTVLADRGSADSAYAAQCSSTYVQINGDWQLALHHQTPVGQQVNGRA